jgi:hypothetical protein
MSKQNFHENYQALADGMNELLYARVVAAKPIEVLSTHDNKLLQVVEAKDGERFVTRSYTSDAVATIEQNYSFGFRVAWEGMHEAFSEAGLEVVPSGLIETDGDYPCIVVSEYLESAQSLAAAPTEIKQTVASGLGKLLSGDCYFVPSPEMVREDMFLFEEHDGQPKVLLADVDPLMTPFFRIKDNDLNSAFFINKLAELAWDKWCSEEERVPVITAMVQELSDYALDKFDFDSATTKAFMDLHLMSNGVDNRDRYTDGSSTTAW